jgi:hypothetical protein
MEDPEINTHTYGQLILDKEPEPYNRGKKKKKASSTNGLDLQLASTQGHGFLTPNPRNLPPSGLL